MVVSHVSHCHPLNPDEYARISMSRTRRRAGFGFLRVLRRCWRHRFTVVAGLAFIFLVLRIKFFLERVPNLKDDDSKNGRGAKQGDDLVDYIAVNLQVVYQPQVGERSHIILINNGPREIPPANWTIYYNDVQRFVNVQKSVVINRKNMMIIRHHDGWLFSMEPVQNMGNMSFETLAPHGGNLTIILKHPLKSRSYTFPRWYVAGQSGSLRPRIIQSTNSEGMEFLAEVAGWNVEKRYDANDVIKIRDNRTASVHSCEDNNRIIPTPLSSVVICEQFVRIDLTWKIAYEENLTQEALYLSGKLEIPMVKVTPQMNHKGIIHLSCADMTLLLAELNHKESVVLQESYLLAVEENQSITISGHLCGSGVFYGIQSLLSLLEGSSDGRTVHVMRVIDAPRLPYRGLMLDVSRNFIAKEDVMKTMDVMAQYKMNKLHFHLTDDQGWRLQIPGLPELTEVGARRGHFAGNGEKVMLLPYVGSDPVPLLHQYYTVEDYRDILRHGKRLHIDVIPEIDMPGHIHSAVLSMRVRRSRLLREGLGEDKASEFLLSDPNDTSEYLGVNNQRDTVLNPCMDSAYTFVEHIFRAINDMHKDILPRLTIHIGGDEVPGGALTRSPICQQLFTTQPELTGIHNLKTYFMKKVVVILRSLGVSVQAWEEGLGGDGENLPPEFSTWNHNSLAINAWNNGKLVPFTFANAGYKVVQSDAAQLYLDHPCEPDFNEPGLFWAARWTGVRKVFNYVPSSSRLARNGTFIHRHICALNEMQVCIDLNRPENVIGISASLWTEMIRTRSQLHYMLYPRLLAVAERAWHIASWEVADNAGDFECLRQDDWMQFSKAVGIKELKRLERMDVLYRLPLPGAKVKNNWILVNTEFPGLPIEYRYSLDSDDIWVLYDEAKPLARTSLPNRVHFRTLSHDKKRKSRTVVL